MQDENEYLGGTGDEGPGPHGLTRRSFLRSSAGLAGVSLVGKSALAKDEALLDLAPGQAPSRVAMARSVQAIDGPTVHRTLVRELFESALQQATRTQTTYDAWHTVLKPDDVIGLKFNRSGQRLIATTDAFAEIVVTSLVDAGWSRTRIVCIEVSPATAKKLGTTAAVPGFDRATTRFASGADQFASVLGQITALISVPFLKSHNICTLTCALKNLSHAIVKHPARFHGQACSPYIADIVAMPAVRTKLRLAIVDALRVVYADGPSATSHNIADTGGLIVSTDVVAADSIGLALLNDVRNRARLDPLAASPAEIPYLVAAHQAGLGVAAPHGIELARVQP